MKTSNNNSNTASTPLDNNLNNLDPIGKALDLAPMHSSTNEIVDRLKIESHDDSARTDFEKARANIHEMIDNGQEALTKLTQIADSSQNPKAFEVLAKFTDTMLQANKDLMDLQIKIREMELPNQPQSQHARTINNTMFVGSTAELQKVIKMARDDLENTNSNNNIIIDQ